MSSPITPGLLVLHGNRLEDLRALTFSWLAQHPLAPLEEAIFLVQSNGIAEWLKVALAQDTGICAATRIELPARFLWRCYRQMLGRDAVPVSSALDKAPLTWRLMRLLPSLLVQPEFAPLQRFLADGLVLRRFQLAERLADLYDQYQVYRADWLDDWAQGRDVLRQLDGRLTTLADDQLWQAALWRAVLADVPEQERQLGRAGVHRRFVADLAAGLPPKQSLPRRVVVFGAAALPLQTLEALAALSRHCQVILAIPNPCQYHWADIMEGRELLQIARRRQQQRGDTDLAALPLDAMHAHSHPLLAAWGRMGRDFIRLLDQFDDSAAAQAQFALPRIDLFDEAPGDTLLQQVQARIRDLAPLDAEDRPAIAEDDRSIVFHIAHSAQREVEILHDQLLTLLANSNIAPRDIVVMVPDIETFAPAIHAVFGQHATNDQRRIPYAIADQKNRGVNPLLRALEWLLQLPDQRCTASELRDLLDVPAIAQRFALQADDLPRLAQWIEGAGVRWGLSSAHRADLGLAACGEQNSWLFGLQRMLLGFACGNDGPYAGIEPYGEVGGLDAALAGALAALVERLQHWRVQLKQAMTPAQWGEQLRALLQSLFTAADERDRLTLAALESALQNWLETCAASDFSQAIPLAVVREAWLAGVDEGPQAQRFLGAGVTFCTLMPMRAIPFAVVCLLGMNDGDYPRRSQRADFDLLAQPNQQRPGDRSRRDDDRYLMLEALLAARQQLYISWTGRNARDNSVQPPSVLVSQLRDYLAAGWQDGVLAARTTEHPLQAFSRRYFSDQGLYTYSKEWRLAHQLASAETARQPASQPAEIPSSIGFAILADFLKSPVKHYFRHRLEVVFRDLEQAAEDEEPFALNALDEYLLVQDFLQLAREQASDDDIASVVEQHTERIARSGALPVGVAGERLRQRLVNTITPIWQQWQDHIHDYPDNAEREALHFSHQGLVFSDWLDGLRQGDGLRVSLQLDPSVLCEKHTETQKKNQQSPKAKADKLLVPWLRQLVASACGVQIEGLLIGRDAVLQLPPLAQAKAAQTLAAIMDAWQSNMQAPLPLASKTALAYLQSDFDEDKARKAFEGDYARSGEIARDPALARVYPDFAALIDDGQFPALAAQLYAPLLEWCQTVSVTMHDADIDDEGNDELRA